MFENITIPEIANFEKFGKDGAGRNIPRSHLFLNLEHGINILRATPSAAVPFWLLGVAIWGFWGLHF